MSFQWKWRNNSKSWKLPEMETAVGAREEQAWEGMSGECGRFHSQSKENLKFYYMQESISLKSSGGMEGTKSILI